MVFDAYLETNNINISTEKKISPYTVNNFSVKERLSFPVDKDSGKNLNQFRKRLIKARRSDLHHTFSSKNSKLPKNSKTKELSDRRSTQKPTIAKEIFSHGGSSHSNYKTAVSNDNSNSDSAMNNQRIPLKYKIQDMITSGLKGYLKNHKRKKRGSIEPKSKSMFNLLTNRIKTANKQF